MVSNNDNDANKQMRWMRGHKISAIIPTRSLSVMVFSPSFTNQSSSFSTARIIKETGTSSTDHSSSFSKA